MISSHDEKEIAEVVLRTRRQAFRDALPEILGVLRRITNERQRGADKMIADYRAIIAGLAQR